MLIELLCFAGCCVLLGIIIGLLIARPVITQKMLEVEAHWKDKLALINSNWSKFHSSKADEWWDHTKKLVSKSIEDRDRAWEKKFSGVKSKPKPSN